MWTKLGTRLLFHLLVCLFMVMQMLFFPLLVVVGALVLSAMGLLMTQHYWHAVFVLALALGLYEGGWWWLIGKWRS